jgi:hypothetical protein
MPFIAFFVCSILKSFNTSLLLLLLLLKVHYLAASLFILVDTKLSCALDLTDVGMRGTWTHITML